jgi:hypothetical protein
MFGVGVVWFFNSEQPYYHRQRYGVYGTPVLVHQKMA